MEMKFIILIEILVWIIINNFLANDVTIHRPKITPCSTLCNSAKLVDLLICATLFPRIEYLW